MRSAVRRHSQTATTGRGLRLLDDVADAWGWEPAVGGLVVWCRLTVACDPWAAYADTDWLAEADL